MLFKSYLKSSKKHISFCVNKSQNHTNRFGKASHFVLAIVHNTFVTVFPLFFFTIFTEKLLNFDFSHSPLNSGNLKAGTLRITFPLSVEFGT